MKRGQTIRTLKDLEREARICIYGIGYEDGSSKLGITEKIEIDPGREIRFRLDACWNNLEGTLAWEAIHSLHTLDAEEPPEDAKHLPLCIRSLYGAEEYVGVVAVVECSAPGILCFHEDRMRQRRYFFYPWHVVLRLGDARYAAPLYRPPLLAPALEPKPEPKPLPETLAEFEEDPAEMILPW